MSSALQTNHQTKRLAKETFTGLHGAILLDLEVEEAENSSAHDEQFHLGNVTTDAGAGAVGEGDESGLLTGSQTIRGPALRHELLGVGTPDFLGAVDGVAGDGEDVTGAEGVAGDDDGGGAFGDLTGKTHGGGAMDAHSFLDNPLQVLDVLDHGVGGDVDIRGDRVIQGLLQLRDHMGGT